MKKETWLFTVGIIISIAGLCIYTTYTKEVVLIMTDIRGLKSTEKLVEAVEDFISPYMAMMPAEQRAIYETAIDKISDELADEKGRVEGELLFQRIGEFMGLSFLVIGIALMIYGRPKGPVTEEKPKLIEKKSQKSLNHTKKN